MIKRRVKTDVLVIGGGLAGCFAAVSAREAGAEVILVEKNYCGKSGSSNYARDFMCYNEKWGDNLAEWRNQFLHIGEYVNNQDWVDILLKESYDRYRDLVSWGVPFYLKGDIQGVPGEDHPYGNAVMSDEIGLPKPDEEPFRYQHQRTKYRPSSKILKFGKRDKMTICRNKVLSCGCTIIDRVMLTDLIKKNGRIIGAAGFHTQEGDFYIIEAKAVVVSSGCLSFRPAYYGINFNAGEGMTMAYRAGAELTGMEFGSGMWVSKDCDTVCLDGPVAELGLTHDAITNGLGEEFLDDTAHLPTNIHWALEEHMGLGPIYHEPYGFNREDFKEEIDKYNQTSESPAIEMMDRAGIDIFHDRFEQYMAFLGNRYPGGVKVNTKCETNIPGLYAAGDACGNNFCGPTYGTLGSGMCNASVTGHRAGEYAAQYAKGIEALTVPEQDTNILIKDIMGPLERKCGYKTEHVLLRIQQTLLPYEVRIIMHEKRLNAALTMIEFFRDHFLPKTFATDFHDLRNFHEVRSMITGAEIMLRTAEFRKESRGWFFREDYPRRDDEHWLKWIIVKKGDNGGIELSTEDVPKEWQGDLTLPYTERYILQYRLEREEKHNNGD